MKFSERLKQLRHDNSLTQSELADIIGLKPTAISNYESNRNEPSLERLIALSKYFDVSCDYLLGITDSYLPIGGEILDKDIVEIYDLYQQLTPDHIGMVKKYIQFLIYIQEKSNTK